MLLRELFDTELLAPNGKKSNLNKGQYYQVRTKEFKQWFGDWENNPEASKEARMPTTPQDGCGMKWSRGREGNLIIIGGWFLYK